jgi:hypothetical protein
MHVMVCVRGPVKTAASVLPLLPYDTWVLLKIVLPLLVLLIVLLVIAFLIVRAYLRMQFHRSIAVIKLCNFGLVLIMIWPALIILWFL